MRILKVSDVYFPRVNGVSTSIETFRRDLLAAGHEVMLVAPDYAGAAPAQPGESTEGVARVAARKVPRDPEDRIMSWRALRRTLSDLGARRIDVVHIHTPFLAHYAALRGCRHAPLTAEGFAATVDDILADPRGLKALGIEAQDYALQWASPRMGKRLAQLYQTLL